MDKLVKLLNGLSQIFCIPEAGEIVRPAILR